MDNMNNKEYIDEVLLDNEKELELSSVDEESVYPMNGITVEKGFYTVYELKRKLEKKQIILDSDFQREDVWKRPQKVELIESILMGLPLPIFYFNQDKNGRLIVIDGRQRLTALFQYMDDMFPLNKLNILPEQNKNKFSDLLPILQTKIEDYQIHAHVIMPPTPDRIKFDIFDRVNRAGMQLNKQEIRNALYQGNATRLLKKLSGSKEFELATGSAFTKDKRMKDKYLLLRFISFYLYFNKYLLDDKRQPYEYKDIDELLGKSMDYLNLINENDLDSITNICIHALKNTYYYLGEDAFRLINAEKKSPINMNLFETIMFVMYQVPLKDNNIKKQLITLINTKMINNNDFIESIGNHRDNINKINTRFKIADNIVNNIVNNIIGGSK